MEKGAESCLTGQSTYWDASRDKSIESTSDMGGKFVTDAKLDPHGACSLILPLFESKALARFSASTHARTLKILVNGLSVVEIDRSWT